ncbi:MAG TPA: CoA transferase, partial [Rhodobacteraceae bacterium]|nr:CoA transferase [Paracoccaceae bacterium]
KILKRLIETVTLARKKKYWLKRLDKAGVPCAAIQNVAEAMSDPQIIARNMVVELAAPDGGKPFLAAGNPIKISDMDDTLKDARAPTLDGDRQAVLDWLDEGE